MTSHLQFACILSIVCCVYGCGGEERISQAKLQEALERQATLEAQLNAITQELTTSEARLKAQFFEIAQELAESKVTLQEERNRQEELEGRLTELIESMGLSRVDVAGLKGQWQAVLAAKVTPITELQMAAEGFQRDIEQLRIEIDKVRQAQTSVEILLERVPAMRLKLKADLRFGGTLDDILAQIALQAGIPMRVLADDLKEEMIATDRRLELNYKNMTVEQILGDLMLKANPSPAEALSDPKLKLVYVITNPDVAGRQEIVVTTRKRAGERGFVPPAFQVQQ